LFLGGVIVVIKNCIQKILIVIGQRKMKGNQLKCKKCPKISSRKLSLGEGIGTAKLLRTHKAALIYKITINAFLESSGDQ
jgi:hypothetical protein